MQSRKDCFFSISKWIKAYPVPLTALTGLILGVIIDSLYTSDTGHLVWMVTLVVTGIPVSWKIFREIVQKHFVADIVALLAIAVSIALNDAFPGVVIVLMQSGGKALEDHAYKRASSSLDELLSHVPRIAYRKKNDMLEEINVSEVKIGDLLVIRPGDLIPVDGKITSSNAEIDESSLTGEPISSRKEQGSQVFSGTINVGRAFEIKATKISDESQYSRIVQLVRKAQEEKAPIQRLADRYAVWFTPMTVVVSIIGLLITNNLETILSVLVVATPCSLIFATPVAIISGINRAAKSGIIVKSGAAIEQVSRAKVVVFDKTGTITFGTPTVEKIISFNDMLEDQLLFMASCLEQFSSHPVAVTIRQSGEEKFGKLPFPKNFRETPGAGVEGDVEGHHVMVGAPSLFKSADQRIFDRSIQTNHKARLEGNMVAFVSINGEVSGVIVFGDNLRPDVHSVIRSLKKHGIIQTILLTGDNFANATKIANQAGIDQFEAELTPEQKVIEIKKWRQRFDSVIMVGDGINDAPALATSTVGIAMGARGAAISAEAADVVLLVDDFSKVASIVEIGKKTISVVKQSVIIGLGASFLLMGIAVFGYLPPATGAILQEVLDISVIINALRAR